MRKLLCVLLCLLFAFPALGEETCLTLTVGGDCVLATREEWQDDADTFLTAVEANGMGWPFQHLAPIFQADDMTLLNLECVLQEGNKGHDYTRQHNFRGKPAYAQMLVDAGVEQVNVANNHFVDYRTSGKRSTLAALDAAGVGYSGYGHLYIWEKDGVKIGFGGCRETVWKKSRTTIRKDIRALKKAGCDLIVYSCHWGREYSPTHNRAQERMADYAIKCGANILIGSHPHVVQGVEVRSGALVLWSLGNLVFGGTHDLTVFDGLLAQLELHFEGKKYLGAQVTLLPVLTSGSAPENDFAPVLAEGADKERILALIEADSPEAVQESMWIPAPVKPARQKKK